jgi:hypothetical protein
MSKVDRGESAVRDYPTVQEGMRGLAFVAATVESSGRGSMWVKI